MTEPSAWAWKQAEEVEAGCCVSCDRAIALALDAAWRAGAEAMRNRGADLMDEVVGDFAEQSIAGCPLPAPGEER